MLKFIQNPVVRSSIHHRGRTRSRTTGTSSSGTSLLQELVPYGLNVSDSDSDQHQYKKNQYSYNDKRLKSTIRTGYTYCHNMHMNMQQYQSYHTTVKKEILPILAIGTIAIVGTYSIKALKRMDQEWEEYEENLKEYKLEHGISDDDDDFNVDHFDSSNKTKGRKQSLASVFKHGQMAFDLGTENLRIAHYQHQNKSSASSSNISNNKPRIIVNREGSRSTPNAIFFEEDQSFVLGNMAAAKIYEKSKSENTVLNPRLLLSKNDDDDDTPTSKNVHAMAAVQKVISTFGKDALEQALGNRKNASSSSNILFAVDEYNGGYNTRPIFTYPPQRTGDVDDDDENTNEKYLQFYQKAVNEIISPPSIAKFIPEPICVVKGARYYNLIPSSSQSDNIMVVDIGGKSTSISIINEKGNKVVYYTSIEGFGGETLVVSLMNYLSNSFYGVDAQEVLDTMGIQRLYDASKLAVMEMSGSKLGRVQINIPYLSVDDKMQPKHLDLGISRNVLEAEFRDIVKLKIIPELLDATHTHTRKQEGILSQSMKQPVDVESLFSSIIMNVFEKSAQNPFALVGVLIVGGGARSPLFQNAVKKTFSNLAGEQFVQEKVVIPKNELVEELVVLGASLCVEEED